MRDREWVLGVMLGEQSSDLARGDGPFEPVPTLSSANHIEPAVGQAGRLRWPLDIRDLYPGFAVQPLGLLQQRPRDVNARNLAPMPCEQSREASRAGAEIDHTRARPRYPSRGKAIE